MASATVMRPSPAPATAVASTSTLLVASWLVRVATLRFELEAVPVIVVVPVMFELAPPIVMSDGSSSSRPVAPCGARVSTTPS